MQKLDTKKLPRHLAVIMDGNGRWARQRMLQRIVGHQKGVEAVRTIVEECSRLGVAYLTLYAFSAENWLRPKTEVKALMSLLKKYVADETPRMVRNDIRFNVIGAREELSDDVNRALDKALATTAGNQGMTLTLALSYGGRQELLRAALELSRGMADGSVLEADVDETFFSRFLYTKDLPDPDLLIRTSGEMRVSNFLLWQTAYSELYFTDTNWPDFTIERLHEALLDFQARERRFGRTSDQLNTRS